MPEVAMTDWPVSRNGRVIGQCVYCDATSGLSTEHAVPYALNGPWTLLKASCPSCRDITHHFERGVLRELYPSIRAVFQMQSRRKKERPKDLPLVVETGSTQQVVMLPLTEYPTYLPIIEFPPPG